MGWLSLEWILALCMAYLIGSIPFAYIAGRVVSGKDIRDEGDRNPGAGNAYRSIGARAGVLVAAADIWKGVIAVLLARGLTGSVGAEMVAGVAVVAGHNWPIFLQMRGGRGAASAVGVFIALVPIPAIPLCLAALALLPLIRSATISLGLIMIPMPFLVWITGSSSTVVVYSVGLPVMIGVRHYFSSRKLQRQPEGQAEGQALPQG